MPVLSMSGLLLLGSCMSPGLEISAGYGAGRMVLEPASQVDFGASSPHGNSVLQEVHMVSTGQEAITVEGISLEKDGRGSFFLANDPAPVTLAGGEGRVLLLGFKPVDPGQFDGVLVIYTDGNGGEPLGATLTGIGCEDSDRDGICNSADQDAWDTGWAPP